MGILRFLLALSVIAVHVGPIFGLRFVPGPIAVQTFFIISGFYMSLILNEKYIGHVNSYKLFITNRLLRLYPLYLLILTISIFTYTVIFVLSDHKTFPVLQNYKDINGSISAYLLLTFSNLFIVGQDIIMFLGFHTSTETLFFTTNFWNTSPMLWTLLFLPPAWSISMELTFYFLAPLLLKKSRSIVVSVILLSILIRVFTYYSLKLTDDPWTYRFFPNEITFFLLGYFSYQIYIFLKKRQISLWLSNLILLSVIFFTLDYSYIHIGPVVIFQFCCSDLLYFLMIVLFVPFLFNHLKSSKIDRFLGDLSYPIYLSHWVVSTAVWMSTNESLKNAWSVALITICLSIVLNVFIAAPVEKYRQRRVGRLKLK